MKTSKILGGAALATLLLALPAFAQDAVAEIVPVIDKGDVAWMLVSTMVVIVMTIPGLALFYGGLVRAKNILSVLTQVFLGFSMISILWVAYGYSLAFAGPTEGGLAAFVGDFSKFFLSGVTLDSTATTFSPGFVLPEMVFVVFQLTFACITSTLIVGGIAERMKFGALMAFLAIWFTFSYIPMAHMVWSGPGLLFGLGAYDFAGGTVVHINSGVAALVAAIVLGPRLGYMKEAIAPHNLVWTYVGAGLLWFGWFGFNAGSGLEANGGAALAFVNTLLATCAAVLAWTFGEWVGKGKPSMLGGASGAVAGLVAITPAAGFVGPMGSIVMGLIAGLLCLWGVTGLKRMLGMDDSLDVFGVHGVGGIVGALLTGVFAAPSLGGVGIYDYVANKVADDYSIAGQVWIQFEGVLTTVVWSGIVALVAYKLVDMLIGLRVPEEEEREGLDITSHGETAYEV